LTGLAPGKSATFEDMWKFTLVNYNAGPGCLGDAIGNAKLQTLPLTWANVSPFLLGACSGQPITSTTSAQNNKDLAAVIS